MKTHHILFAFIVSFFVSFSAFGQEGFSYHLNYVFHNASPGEEVILDVVAGTEIDNLIGLNSIKGSFLYDESQFSFVGTENFLFEGMSAANFTNIGSGILTFVWEHPSVDGTTPVEVGDILFSFRFERLFDGLPDFSIGHIPQLANTKIFVEFDDWPQLWVLVNGDLVYDEPVGSLISGNIYYDENGNCQYDNEYALQEKRLIVDNGANSFEVFTDSNGEFEFYLFDGDFEFSLAPESNIWGACPPFNLSVNSPENYTVNLGLQQEFPCEQMSVQIATPILTRCFEGVYTVQYCNIGNLPVDDAVVTVNLDEDLSFISGTINPSSQVGNVLIFEPGFVQVGECGTFEFTVQVGCEDDGVVLGQTHCTSAEITPYDTCDDPDPFWDGSSLEVTGSCEGDEVIFLIKNNGADMQQSSEFIVIEDELIMNQEPINLSAGEEVSVPFAANGGTYRAEVQQSSGHPGMSMPTFTVEGCGVNGQGGISLGYVTMFPEDDADPNVSVFCMENVGSYDPNDKQGFPRGATEEHFIEPNTDIEYMIRFQNTGTAPAVDVYIIDELSSTLDPASFRPGVSSHPYVLEYINDDIPYFIFENIMLPDSASNLAASQGFVTFRISQTEDLPDNTLIENQASILFDSNSPIYTNTTVHKVGRDFLEVVEVISNTTDSLQPSDLQVAPNPLTQTAVFKIKGLSGEHTFTLYDLQGKLVREESFAGEEYRFDRKTLAAGMYLFEIAGRSGKLILKN